ncbi:helix-turn-helix domain-containing protein [Kitasatospora sp. NPDC001683]
MLSGRRYRLELTSVQAELCEMFGNICRSVWNTALEQRREYRRRGTWMNYVPQAAELAEAKKEFPWLADAPSHVLQQTLRDWTGLAVSTGRSRFGGVLRGAGGRRSAFLPGI